MNFEALYLRFIETRRGRVFGAGEYSERHHIIPRCEGGGDEPENLIRLSARDHIFAHLILAKWKGGVHWASLCYIFGNFARRRLPTAQEIRIAALARVKTAEVQRGTQPSAETRAKMSIANSGRIFSDEHRAKIGESNRGKKFSPEHRAKLSAAREGKTPSPEHRAKIKAANQGQKRSPEARANMVAAWVLRRARVGS